MQHIWKGMIRILHIQVMILIICKLHRLWKKPGLRMILVIDGIDAHDMHDTHSTHVMYFTHDTHITHDTHEIHATHNTKPHVAQFTKETCFTSDIPNWWNQFKHDMICMIRMIWCYVLHMLTPLRMKQGWRMIHVIFGTDLRMILGSCFCYPMYADMGEIYAFLAGLRRWNADLSWVHKLKFYLRMMRCYGVDYACLRIGQLAEDGRLALLIQNMTWAWRNQTWNPPPLQQHKMSVS
jgi:hypothetical protein